MRNFVAAIVSVFCILASHPAAAQQQVVPCSLSPSHSKSACELTPSGISTALESSHLMKSTGGVLVGGNLNNWNTASGVTIMALDGSTVPATGTTLPVCSYTNGTPNPNPCLMKWYGVATAPSAAQPSTVGITWAGGPLLRMMNGLIFLCSSTGPYLYTATSQCTFSAEVF